MEEESFFSQLWPLQMVLLLLVLLTAQPVIQVCGCLILTKKAKKKQGLYLSSSAATHKVHTGAENKVTFAMYNIFQ